MLTFDGSRSFERRFVYQWDRKATIWLHFGRLASIPHIFVLFSATPQYSSHSCTDVTNCIPNSPGQAICWVLLACTDGPPPHSCRSASSRGLSGSPPARPHPAPSDPTACPSWKSRMHSPRILASSRFNESTAPRARTLIEPAPEVYGSRTPANFKLNHLRGHPTRGQQEERPQVLRLLTKAGPLHGTIPRAQSSPPIRDYLPHSPRASSSSATPAPTRSTSAVSQTQRTDHRCWLQELDMIVERTRGVTDDLSSFQRATCQNLVSEPSIVMSIIWITSGGSLVIPVSKSTSRRPAVHGGTWSNDFSGISRKIGYDAACLTTPKR